MSRRNFTTIRVVASLTLLWALMLVLCRAAAPEKSSQKLRSLAVLPMVSFNVGVSVAQAEGQDLTKPEVKRRIARLRDEVARDPKDAERFLQLAEYLSIAELGEATNAFVKAAELFRARAEARPEDGEIQVRFAKALTAIGKEQEAERILHDAVKNAPSNWICWAGLGDRLDSKTSGILLGDTSRVETFEQFLQLLDSASSRELTVAQRDEVHAYRREAQKCFERSVSLAPRDPAALLSRAAHLWQDALAERTISALTRKEPFESRNFFEIVSTPETRAAFAEASRLTTTNYATIGNWGWLEAAPAFRKLGEGKPMDTLAATGRKNVLEAISLLEKLSEHANPRIAAGAFEMLGLLRMVVMADAASGKIAFQRAVALDPEREGSWEGLAGSIVDGGDFQKLAQICEERLKYDDSPRNRVVCAKTFDRIGQPTKAVEQTRKAVALDPNDLLARICAGALLLKHPETPDADSEMRQHFSKALELMSQAGKGEPLAAPYFLNTAIVLALDGRTDEARQILQKLKNKEIEGQAYTDRIPEIEAAIGN